MIKEQIKREIQQVVGKQYIDKINIFSNPNLNFGDYTTNIAMIVAAKEKRKAREVGEEIIKRLKNSKINELIEKIEVVEPGYINFYLKTEIVFENLDQILEIKDQYGNNSVYSGKKVLVEFTDPNPFKEFHIGHLFSNAVGESIARLFEFAGAEVKRACYQGDVGLHVAKTLWALRKFYFTEYQNYLLKPGDIEGKVQFLGNCYVRGNKFYEEDEQAKQEIQTLNKTIYQESDKELNAIYQKGRAWSLEYFEILYKKLGTKFNDYYFEGETGKFGQEIVEKGLKKGVFQKSEGAIVFKGEKYGLHTRVFINKLGLPTYEAKDLGLAFIKNRKYPSDLSLIITGNEVNEYFKVVLQALNLLSPEIAKNTKHLGHGMLRFAGEKISSRLGNVITGTELVTNSVNKAKKMVEQVKKSKLSKEEFAQISEAVGIAAIKYSMLKQEIGKNFIYDLEKASSLTGNSGPYLQYTYARGRSVINKSKGKIPHLVRYRTVPDYVRGKQNFGLRQDFGRQAKVQVKRQKLNNKEINLLKKLFQFPGVVEKAGQNYAPNLIATYLNELAQMFNSFYNEFKIIEAKEGKEIENFRLMLTFGVTQVIKNGLWLLGIKTVERL